MDKRYLLLIAAVALSVVLYQEVQKPKMSLDELASRWLSGHQKSNRTSTRTRT